MSEDDLIGRIRRKIPSATGGMLRLGIGDDAAIVRPGSNLDWVISTDQFLENVHFRADVHPPDVIGYRAVARATSDLAAMGARPRLFFLSMALPADRVGSWFDGVLGGMARAARRFGLRLAGGDTARSANPAGGVAFDLTVLGEVTRGHAIGRSGARAGDAIFVSGQLGAAQLGLELALHGKDSQKKWKRLLAPHYYPIPMIDLGIWLSGKGYASAMMDLSDGLSTDLGRLCKASGVAALVHEAKLPVVALPLGLKRQGGGKFGFNTQAMALHGGEDYGLLFTVPKRFVSRMPASLYGVRITQIGEIIRGRGMKLVSAGGKVSKLTPAGWDHFRNQ